MAEDIETIKFLIDMLSSIKSSLSSVDKETSRKAQNIQDISEQLIIIVDALKTFNDSNLRNSDSTNQKIENLTRSIDNLKAKLDVFEVRFETLGPLVKTVNEIHMRTEVSAEALANIENYVVDSREFLIDLKIKNGINKAISKKPNKSKFPLSTIADFLNGLEGIYKIILGIFLAGSIITTICMQSHSVKDLFNILKGLF